MVLDEVLLLPKPCSTRKAARRSPERNPAGTCTTPESFRPAEGKVTASSVIGVLSVAGRDWTDFIGTVPGSSSAFRLAEAELAPPGIRLIDVVLLRPYGRREAGAAEVGIGVVVQIHGGVDQHPVPFAGTEQRGVAVALAHRWIEAKPEGRRHDDDVVLPGIDAVRDRPVDRGVVVDVDVVVDHCDVLVAHVRGR